MNFKLSLKPFLVFVLILSSFTVSSLALAADYKISASAGKNGTISPAGTTEVQSGASQSYTITADSGYVIAAINVDGKAISNPSNTYTFSDVTANHTIVASFALSDYTITATAGANGSISPSGDTVVNYDGLQNYTITPNTGYQIATLTVNGKATAPVPSFTFSNVTQNNTITATFAPLTYKITASVTGQGSISPAGSTTVGYNGTENYTIKPAANYLTASVSVDGVLLTSAPTSYAFSNVTANHTISAIFVPATYTITSSVGKNGTISPAGTIKVNYQASETYTVTPDSGYAIATETVDGKTLSAIQNTFTFSDVTASHSIQATFTPSAYTITATASAGGTITPNGVTKVNAGGSQNYIITPNTGYEIDTLTANGVKQTPTPSFTFGDVEQNDTISVTFKQITYTITATRTGYGSISPLGATTVAYGSSQTFNLKPDNSFVLATLTVDGTIVSNPGVSYTFSNVTASHTIAAIFVPAAYVISADAGTHGTITPAGNVKVNYANSQAFTITPDSGYAIATETVDGVKVSNPTTSYTFSDVTSNHSISATFTPTAYTITATAGTGGTISPAGVIKVNAQASQMFEVIPNTGYALTAVVVDGSTLKVYTPSVYTYTFGSVIANHTINAVFTPITFTITASATGHGSVTPNGVTTVNYGASQAYTIKADNGYLISSLTVDGTAVTGTLSSYSFSNVTANHTIVVTFAPSAFTITASAGKNGAVSPAGKTTVSYDGSQTYNFTPDSGFVIGSILIDGVAVSNPTSSYTFSNVIANHSIVVSFVSNTYTVTATTGANGSISPAGITVVPYEGSQNYTVIPDSGYQLSTLIINGATQPLQLSFTVSNVTKNTTVYATFTVINSKVSQLYQVALTAISQYQSTPSNTNLNAALQAVLALQPYTGVDVSPTNLTDVYDDALNKLLQAVQSYLTNTPNKMLSISAPADADNSFGASEVLDSGSLYISSPSSSSNGFGTVYEFTRTTEGGWALANTIMPATPNAGDHFGRLIAVKDNFMAVSAEPSNGEAKVYIFTRQAQGSAWVQQNELDLTTYSTSGYPELKTINQITLAASVNQDGGYVVVGLPEYGKYMIFDQAYVYATSGEQALLGSDWRLALEGKMTNSADPIAVAADGDYIAIGSSANERVRILLADNVEVKNTKTSLGTGNLFYTNWAVDPNVSGDITSSGITSTYGDGDYFGLSVAIDQSPEPTAVLGAATMPVIPTDTVNRVNLAIGVPEGASFGAVVTMTKAKSSSNEFVWSKQNLVDLLLPAQPQSATNALTGYTVSLNGNALVITAKEYSTVNSEAFGPVTADATPSQVMVYQLNAANQWQWNYTLNTPYGASITTDGTNVAYGEPVPNGQSGNAQVTVVNGSSVASSTAIMNKNK